MGSGGVVASLLQTPPQASRAGGAGVAPERDTQSPASSGSLKMKFSFSADKREATVMSGPSAAASTALVASGTTTPAAQDETRKLPVKVRDDVLC